MSINRVNISGNLTRDSELRTTQGGTAVLGFGVAVNDRRRNPQTDEWEDFPNYVDCTMFGARAEKIAQYLTKGTKVAIEGKLRWSQWTDKQSGQKRSKLEVIVDEIEFLSRDRQGQQGGYQTQPAYAAPQPQPAYATPPQGGYQQAPQPAYATGGYMPHPVIAPPQAAPQPAYATPPQAAPVQQQLAGMPQAAPPTPDMYDEDIPF